MTGTPNMPEVDPKNSEQNAWVQDWLTAWERVHPGGPPEEVSTTIEIIQGTYDYSDHRRRV